MSDPQSSTKTPRTKLSPTSLQKIFTYIIPRAARNSIKTQPDGSLRVYVTQTPNNGKANAAVIKMLAKYFAVARSRILLHTGATNRHKIFIIQ